MDDSVAQRFRELRFKRHGRIAEAPRLLHQLCGVHGVLRKSLELLKGAHEIQRAVLKRFQDDRGRVQEHGITKQRCKLGSQRSRKRSGQLRAVLPYLTGAPRLLRRCALAVQQRVRRAPALHRLHRAGEQGVALHAVQHETAHHVNAIRRAGNEVDERVGALQLQVHRHEVVRAQRARSVGGATVVLRSAENAPFA